MILTKFALLALIAVSIYLVFSKKYEDGVIGRVALGLIALGSAAKIICIVAGTDTTNPDQLIDWAVALFLIRHAYRYHRWSTTGRGDWRKTGAITG